MGQEDFDHRAAKGDTFQLRQAAPSDSRSSAALEGQETSNRLSRTVLGLETVAKPSSPERTLDEADRASAQIVEGLQGRAIPLVVAGCTRSLDCGLLSRFSG